MKKAKDERVTGSRAPTPTGSTCPEETATPSLQRSTSPTQTRRTSRLSNGTSSVSSSTSTVTSIAGGPLSRPPFKVVNGNSTSSWKSLREGTSTPPSVSSKKDLSEKPRLGLMQELLDTRKENNAVRSSNSQLKEELMKYKSVVQSLESQGFAMQSHCSVADETKLVTSKVLQSLTQQLLTERSEKKEFMEMLEQEGKELQSVIAVKDQLEVRLQALLQKVSELENAKQDLEHSKQDLEDHLQSQLEKATETARSRDTELQKMRLELAAAHDEITALAGAFQNIKNTLARVNAARETAEAQVATLKAQMSQDQEARQAEIEQLQRQMGIQAELLRSRDMQITELEAKLAEASQALQDLPQQLAAVNNALADARKELATCGKRKKKPSLVFKLLSGALGVVSTLLVQRLHNEWGANAEESKQQKGLRLLFWRVSVSKA
ncbi:hypothetical protein COCSUDRAFT_67291 [Coccomyxa subellipsoidea C-169]|uniref:Uncharacterized protein n=1 Tax=Coccomyxa subellipsoidea (strain C-169) TaxID=574566 RepID=I0YR82_COCSC|nr:hypothetical protein COCSUDRAFT_67291 [Coccomyxa subellipsoidea C-169]EIE20901.1 hypothetical protein COCSUDRAFT_67291 [Coccomyxa subellipsoidea C-169]|eukprot:XP_005645445.1 hypothetical protein COCSUDRAFT_67291 [Coccomyxa subellipsoidea C-169]